MHDSWVVARRSRTVVLGITSLILAMPASMTLAQPALKPPRTPDGRPDLQGVWDFSTQIPLERPKEMGQRAVMTPEEIAGMRAKTAKAVRGAYQDPLAPIADDQPTSLIIDPPDGRLPPLQPGMKMEVGNLNKDVPGTRPYRIRGTGMSADNPEDRGPAERCLVGFNSGPPIVPQGYNQNVQIVQTRDYVVIVNEMVHDARIVPLDGRPYLPPHIRRWMGDSRGRWEGDTLVVETTNFTEKTASFHPSVTQAIGSGITLRLTERFRLVGPDALRYEFTVNDLTTFTRPFTAVVRMRRGTAFYEYACHEANHSMGVILRGGRVLDEAK
jgi:hypothetical protein